MERCVTGSRGACTMWPRIIFSTTLTSHCQTCTYLAEISRTKDIWKHLVDEHIKADVLPPRLERPVSMHSSLELEHLLLRWKSADHALTSDTFQPARERTFMGVDPESLHLITGGRWLLVRNQKAGVTYYDLDSETISGVELIPEQLDGTLTCQVTMCIEHDMQSPFLGFLIALSLLGPSSEMDPTGFTKNWCHSQIWHVKAVLDNMQRVIGLTATLVASFPYREWIFGVYSLSLRGPNLAIHAYASYGSCAFVVNWRQANADPLKYTLRLVGGTILQMVNVIQSLSTLIFTNFKFNSRQKYFFYREICFWLYRTKITYFVTTRRPHRLPLCQTIPHPCSRMCGM